MSTGIVVERAGTTRLDEGTDLMGTKTYEWGHAGRLRAHRDYFGLTVNEMAERLGMSRRSYQRMETGEAAIPSTLWDTIAETAREFERAITRVVHAASETGMPTVFDLAEDASGWQRMIVARAVHAAPIPGLVDVKVPDDYRAEQEMDG